ncbi:protein-disulfide reductase DsbD domain-containing protein [Porticoccus sp. GXU_MW_L64]
MKRILLSASLLLAVQLLAVVEASSQTYTDDNIAVSLVSEHNALQPGTTQWLGVQFKPADHWHVYWQNPGDSGQAPRIDWQLPPGISVGNVQWPAPERIPVAHLMNYGYHDVLLMVPVTVAPDVPPGRDLSIAAKIRWLVCEEVCIPGKANLQMTLPVANSSQKSAVAQAFTDARQLLPQSFPASSANYSIEGDRLVLELYKDMAGYQNAPVIFPITQDLVSYSQLPELQKQGKRLVASFAISDYFSQPPSSFEFVIAFDQEAIYQVTAPYLPKGE